MNLEKELEERSGSKCELCQSTNNLQAYEVAPTRNNGSDDYIFICETCHEQIDQAEKVDPNHWRCLNDSMWSEVPAVQAVSWRMLKRLSKEGWSQDLLDMMYMEEETLKWAKAPFLDGTENKVVHLDSNGNVLQSGDSVVLIKDLNVKGASFTAKRGTAVRRISLVLDNPEHIEGKINGQQIVILTKFVKKS